MSKTQEALKLALEALSKSDDFLFDWHENESDNEADAYATARHLNEKAITAIREALAEQPAQQEPVVWKDEQGNVRMTLDSGEIQSSVGYVYSVKGERIKNACIRSDIPNGTPLYTSPPASKPLSNLTEDNIPAIPPASKPLTDEQITAGARALCQQMAEACNVDAGDQWQLYADTFKEDAKAVLTAAAKLRERGA